MTGEECLCNISVSEEKQVETALLVMSFEKKGPLGGVWKAVCGDARYNEKRD